MGKHSGVIIPLLSPDRREVNVGKTGKRRPSKHPSCSRTITPISFESL
jgi:hypothetical protein